MKVLQADAVRRTDRIPHSTLGSRQEMLYWLDEIQPIEESAEKLLRNSADSASSIYAAPNLHHSRHIASRTERHTPSCFIARGRRRL